jgi:FtsP/CotA-like multicopper oxidase with cupredoxin domain
VSTHLHNNHGPSESDGNPCDFFGPHEALDDSRRGTFYDHHYPNVLAGIYSTHPGVGDINESLSTLWYHDHRVDFTSQNVYKGLAGFYLLFNQFDSGDETTGFRLPGFPAFDIPLLFNDKVIDPISGQLFFDLFNLDGILGDKFLVNGHVQPKLTVSPRRYRFRLLDAGPSRFYQFHLTDPASPSTVNRFHAIANDGNLLPKPVLVDNVRISVAERMDVIIDFTPFAGKSLYLENRLEQVNGRGPTGRVLAPGQGNNVLRFDVVGPPVVDNSADPATIAKFYDVPNNTETPRVTRTFRFERGNGMWQINGKFVDCTPGAPARFRIKQNTVERWILQNNSGGWQHPIHIHFEEFQMLKRNGVAPPAVERGRKDVARLQFNEQIELFFRFRDFVGRYPMHCHNVVHEDHAMMLRWDIV